MRMMPRVRAHHQTRNVNVIGLEIFGQIVFISNIIIRNSIVSNERVSQDQNLTAVRRICQGFRVSHHARVKDNFSGNRSGGSKGPAFNGGAVIRQVEQGGVALVGKGKHKRKILARIKNFRGGSEYEFNSLVKNMIPRIDWISLLFPGY